MELEEDLKTKSSSDYLTENTGLDDVEGIRPSKPSEVSDFFEGQNVLITGASGFVGKLLIEKLLRYVLNRNYKKRQVINFCFNYSEMSDQ